MARGEGVPAAESDTVLTIEVTNLASRPTEVTSVHVGYMYMNGLSEAVFGTKAPELPLCVLSGQASHPATLGPGESVVWTASLEQLAAEARERRLTLGPHSSWLEPNSLEPLERGVASGKWVSRFAATSPCGATGVWRLSCAMSGALSTKLR